MPGGLAVELLELLVRLIPEQLGHVPKDRLHCLRLRVLLGTLVNTLWRDAALGQVDVACGGGSLGDMAKGESTWIQRGEVVRRGDTEVGVDIMATEIE